MKKTNNLYILLVEDNPADVLLMEEALAETGVPCLLHTMNNGDKAMAFLRCQGIYNGNPPADLILLDLNLPGRHGHEVLTEIKNDEKLKHIPVLIFSSSNSAMDIRASYRLHASSHITKPADLDEFISTVKDLISYWYHLAELPRLPLSYFKSEQAQEHYGTADNSYTALRG